MDKPEVKLRKVWQNRIEKEKKAHKKFRDQAETAVNAARDDDTKSHAFNIFWGNSKVIRAAIYGNLPKPDVRRRFQKPDPEEKELARMVERALEYQLDISYFDCASQSVVKDYVEAGLGVPRVYLDTKTEPVTDEMGEPILDEEGEPVERIVAQEVGIEHIPWNHFHWEPGKSWQNCDWVAFESFHPRKELEQEYGVKISSGKDNEQKREAEEYTDEVQVFEIWHKPTRTVLVYAPSHPVLLEQRKDTLQLQGFFPCPRPLFANLKSDELIPKPDYCFVQSQVEELNRLVQRRKSLASQVRANGFTDASIAKEIGRLVEEPDGTIKGIDVLLERLQAVGGTADKLVHYLPMIEIVQAIQQLGVEIQETKQQIYEISGISDIIRGATQASETAAAQRLKGQWANVRLSEQSTDVARLWRDVFRMWAEIICEHFEPMILTLQTGIQITPNMLSMMKSDIGRSFAIDVETDSTLQQDDIAERESRMELLDTVYSMIERAAPGITTGVLPVEVVQESILFAVSSHKHGKQLEDAVMSLGPHWSQFQQFQQQLQQMQQELMQRDQMLQQAGQQVAGLQGELGKWNEREEGRKDAETQVKVLQGRVDAAAQHLENRITAAEQEVDYEIKWADLDLKQAQAEKVRADAYRTVNPQQERAYG